MNKLRSIKILETVHKPMLKGIALRLGIIIGVSLALTLLVGYLETGSIIPSVEARWVRKPVPG